MSIAENYAKKVIEIRATQYKKVIKILYTMGRKNKKKMLLLLEELRIIQEKDIFYNGFNIKTKPIDTSGILPVNFLDSHNQYIRNTKQFDIINLYLL